MSENTNVVEKGYELKTVSIFGAEGKEPYDVYPQMTELHLFEDIYNTTMSGKITLSDSIDLFSICPLSGFDYIKIIVNKKGYDREILLDKTFRIYKIISAGTSNKATASNQLYDLYFCSEENILSISTTISKSYKSKTSTQIVTDILSSYLKVAKEKIVPENIEESYGRYDIIIPYMNPLAAINWISSRTLSSGGKSVGPNFLFFENKEGYNFKSLEKIFKKDTKVRYAYNAKNMRKDNENSDEEYHDVITYEFSSIYDIIGAIKNGMFSSVLKTVDLTRLRADDVVLNYNKDFDNTLHVENELITNIQDRKKPFPFHNKSKDRFRKELVDYSFALRRLYPTNLDHNIVSGIAGRQPGLNPNLVEKWMLQRITRLNQLNYFKLKLTAPGDTWITIGDIIEFSIPLTQAKEPGKPTVNPYYSGRYLVTAIRHQMSMSKYEMIIEATRDCLAFEYPDADNISPMMQEIKKQ